MSYTYHHNYKTCDICGSNLDLEERCCCQEELVTWTHDTDANELVVTWQGKNERFSYSAIITELA